MYKYRTMVLGADKILEDLMASDPKIREEYQKNKKLSNDPRITSAGHFCVRRVWMNFLNLSMCSLDKCL